MKLFVQVCAYLVPGVCMISTGQLVDEAVWKQLNQYTCTPDCNNHTASCTNVRTTGDAGVTAVEAGGAVSSHGARGQIIGALIALLSLLLVAMALLAVVLVQRYCPVEAVLCSSLT